MLELITGPMTGQQYLDSLQDGREVYIYGERVKDVVTHRAFRNAARSIARLYDALHDPKHKDALLATDRQGILTHKFFKPSYSAQELLEADRKSTRLNSSHLGISYAVFCLKKKTKNTQT